MPDLSSARTKAPYTVLESSEDSVSMAVVTDSREQTGLGNYFVANYPPFAAWLPEHVDAARAILNQPPAVGVPLGLYLHIPFCRKRCKFCYFRVYTDKNADDVTTYSNALIKEVELYS